MEIAKQLSLHIKFRENLPTATSNLNHNFLEIWYRYKQNEI